MLARLHICIPSPFAFRQEAGVSPEAFPVHLAEPSLLRGLAVALAPPGLSAFHLSLFPGRPSAQGSIKRQRQKKPLVHCSSVCADPCLVRFHLGKWSIEELEPFLCAPWLAS